MTRYINADNAIAAICHRLYVSVYDARMVIDNIPTEDVKENVHGEWINGYCNKCGKHAPYWSMASTYYESDYCPNCGAVMDMKQVNKL